MVRSTWAELTAGLNEADLALFETYRRRCAALPDVEERVHHTELQFAVERVFTSGYMKSHHLEIAIDLLRIAENPHLRQAFHTTRRVITHRLTIDSVQELDTAMDLIREAHETVGPGSR